MFHLTGKRINVLMMRTMTSTQRRLGQAPKSFGTVDGMFHEKERGDESRWIREQEEQVKHEKATQKLPVQNVALMELQSILGNDAALLPRRLKMKLVQWKLGNQITKKPKLGEQDDNYSNYFGYDSTEHRPSPEDPPYRWEYDPPLLPYLDKSSEEYQTIKRRVLEKALKVKKHPSAPPYEK